MANRNTSIVEVSADRRAERRIKVALGGKFRRLSDELHTLITVNVSEDGMLFIAGERMEPGALIELKLPLSETDREVAVVGRVTRVRGLGGGKFCAAIRFVQISSADRRLLMQQASRPGMF